MKTRKKRLATFFSSHVTSFGRNSAGRGGLGRGGPPLRAGARPVSAAAQPVKQVTCLVMVYMICGIIPEELPANWRVCARHA
jgi:hypothetical protein